MKVMLPQKRLERAVSSPFRTSLSPSLAYRALALSSIGSKSTVARLACYLSIGGACSQQPLRWRALVSMWEVP